MRMSISFIGSATLLLASNALAHVTPFHDAVFREDATRLPASLASEQSGTSSSGVNLVDVDLDGDLDIFLVEGTASLDVRPNLLLINDGDGFFTDESLTRLPQGMDANSTKAEFADVDGDGDLDAIVANVGPEQLLLNDGNGYFSDGAARLPTAPDIFSDISANVHFADVTEDGCPDILIGNENPFDPDLTHGAQNRLLINDCSGTFTDETSARLPARTDQTAGFVSGDIDADGDTDVIVLNRGPDVVLVNDGAGFFRDETATRLPGVSDTTRSGALADMDGNGSLDLVVSNSRGEAPRLYLNSGRGVFREGRIYYTEAADETDTELRLVDLNGDRYPDVFIANAGKFDSGHGFEGGPDHFFENHRGRLVEATSRHAVFPPIQASLAAAFGDLDGDGDDDLVVAGTGDGEMGRERVFLQLGPAHRRCDRPHRH